MDILINTLADALPMFTLIASLAGFVLLVKVVMDAPSNNQNQNRSRRRTFDMVRDTRYLDLG
jgi:hypothetical protein